MDMCPGLVIIATLLVSGFVIDIGIKYDDKN